MTTTVELPAVVIESVTTDGDTLAVRVTCPWCNSKHQHAWNAGQDFAQPRCGTPGVGYWMQWPKEAA